MKVGDWVAQRNEWPMYGYIIRIWRGKFVVSWGWRCGGNWNGLAAAEELKVIPSPSRVMEKGVELIQECLKKYRWKFSKSYAYDAASMKLFQYIIERMDND